MGDESDMKEKANKASPEEEEINRLVSSGNDDGDSRKPWLVATYINIILLFASIFLGNWIPVFPVSGSVG